jgi:AraC-like DNA-binding protein
MPHLSIASLTREEGHMLLAEVGEKNPVPFVASPLDRGRRVVLEHDERVFGDVSVTRSELGNYVGARSSLQARTVAEPHIVLHVVEPGFDTEHNDRQIRGRANGIHATWTLSPIISTASERSVGHAMSIPLERLGLPHLLLRDVIGTDLTESPLGQLLRSFTVNLATVGDVPQHQGDSLAEPILDLTRATLAAAIGAEPVSQGPLSRTLGTRILIYLRGELGNPNLTPELIAARFGISRRYLYVTLAQLGVSLGDWLREERLKSAAQSLRDPALAIVSVAAIARRAGFVDHSTFSRAFRARYGCTPTEWRTTLHSKVHTE